MLPLLGAMLVGYLALALQATVVHAMGVGGIRPDLPLLAVVLLASAVAAQVRGQPRAVNEARRGATGL